MSAVAAADEAADADGDDDVPAVALRDGTAGTVAAAVFVVVVVVEVAAAGCAPPTAAGRIACCAAMKRS